MGSFHLTHEENRKKTTVWLHALNTLPSLAGPAQFKAGARKKKIDKLCKTLE